MPSHAVAGPHQELHVLPSADERTWNLIASVDDVADAVHESLEMRLAASVVSNLDEIKLPLVAYWLYPIWTWSRVGVAVVSVVAKLARYCTYRFVPSEEIVVVAALLLDVQSVHVPSGVATFPALAFIEMEVLAGVVDAAKRVESGEATPRSTTAEVNVPEAG